MDIRLWDIFIGKSTVNIVFPAVGLSVVQGNGWVVEFGVNPYLRWCKGFELIVRNVDAIALFKHLWFKF